MGDDCQQLLMKMRGYEFIILIDDTDINNYGFKFFHLCTKQTSSSKYEITTNKHRW